MSDDRELLFALAPCFLCGNTFEFNPETVLVVAIDPQTNRPPDVDENGNQVEPTTEAIERATPRPICPDCKNTLIQVASRRFPNSPIHRLR